MPKKITEIKGTTCDQIAEILKADPTLGWRPIELDHKIKDAEYPAILIQLKKLQEAGLITSVDGTKGAVYYYWNPKD